MELSNQIIAKLLREIAAAYTIKKEGNIFQIRAYEQAADSIEHQTAEVKDLWEEGRLDEIPGLGEKIKSYLDELFRTGKVKHFEDIEKGIPKVIFEFLDIPGVGPKTAMELVNLGVTDLKDLKTQIKRGQLVNKGFSAKIAQKLMNGIGEVENRGASRILLPYASNQAARILDYLKKSPDVLDVHPLGSLRRMVATVGDLDFSVSSNSPQKVVEYFCKMPAVSRVVEKGPSSATVVLASGLQLDLLVGKPSAYGALLQHFTGSKNHNIHLRSLAQEKGYSLSEYGVRFARHPEPFASLEGKLREGSQDLKSKPRDFSVSPRNDIVKTETEDIFYKLLGMETPPPEIREDTGEIEAALEHNLPDLVEFKDIKGDLHLHSNYPIKNPSHGPGADSMEDMVRKAQDLGYEYVGISDHPPGFSVVSKEEVIRWVQKRTKFIQSLNTDTKSVRVLNGLEVDILGDGTLSVPDEALYTLDYCIAGIHSGHRGAKDEITKRLMAALENPHVDIISHPTNRLLNERDSSEADWEIIFKYCAKNNERSSSSKKLLEINGYPNRLDLRDDLVREALRYGVKFVINTDAHELEQMDHMKFGVSVARRGWAEAKDVVNAWGWTKFKEWFKL